MARLPRSSPSTDDWTSRNWPYTMPTPEVKEGGHSLWELWQAEKQRQELAFGPTLPSAAAPLPLAAEASAATAEPDLAGARRLSADLLMTVARRNNRVCPRQGPWTTLYEALGGPRCADLQPPPVQDWIWTRLSPLEKRVRFREHVRWAARHGQLRQVALFIRELAEAEWLHMGEK
jgi:hypothetical protein